MSAGQRGLKQKLSPPFLRESRVGFVLKYPHG